MEQMTTLKAKQPSYSNMLSTWTLGQAPAANLGPIGQIKPTGTIGDFTKI